MPWIYLCQLSKTLWLHTSLIYRLTWLKSEKLFWKYFTPSSSIFFLWTWSRKKILPIGCIFYNRFVVLLHSLYSHHLQLFVNILDKCNLISRNLIFRLFNKRSLKKPIVKILTKKTNQLWFGGNRKNGPFIHCREFLNVMAHQVIIVFNYLLNS